MAVRPTDRIRSLFDHYVQQVRSGARPDRAVTLASAPPDSRAELDRLIEQFHSLSERTGRRTAPHVAGNRVGEYLLVRELGSGGLGGVWEAECADGKRVALKLLHLQHQYSHEVVQRFQREGKVGQRLHHPSIVQVVDFGEVSGTPYLAQELIPGGRTVRDWVAESRLLPGLPKDHFSKVAEVFVEIAEALDVVHRAGIVHRDIKPGNILLTPEGRPKVADFGAVKDLDPAATQGQTVDGNLVGTYSYLSPEQSSAKRLPVDPRADIFSLGATLYEALTLEQAFPGDTPQQILQKILLEDPIPPQKVRSQVPGPLALICLKCMEKRPSQRYAAMADLAAELRRFLRKEAILTRAPGPVARAWKWSARNPVKSTAGAVTGAALVAISALAMNLAWALQAETDRARELDLVAEFQSEQLGAIDAEAMGWGIRTALFEKSREAGERVRRTEEELEQSRAWLESSVAGADFTNLALGVLDEHFFKSARESIKKFDDQPLVKARLLAALGTVQKEVGLIQPARESLEESLAIYQRDLDPEDPRLLQAQEEYGVLLGEFGDERATELLSGVLTVRRRSLGVNHPDTLASINFMGSLFLQMGQYEEAEPYLRESLIGHRDMLGEDHTDTINSMQNLSSLLLAMGKYEEAEPYQREVLERCRRVRDADNISTLSSIAAMGSLLLSMGNYEEAEPFIRESLEGHRRVLGSDHPSTLSRINDMGSLLGSLGKYAEAEPFIRESLEGHRRVLGSTHPATLASINNLGVLLDCMSRYEEAEPLLRESLQGRRLVLGADHPDTLGSIDNVGSNLESMGKYAEAEPFFHEALGGRRRVLGSDHPRTLRNLTDVGAYFISMGRYAEAESYLRESYEGCRRVLGADHPDTLGSIKAMGVILLRTGKYAEAEQYLRESLEGCRRVLGSDHLDTLGSINNMGYLLQSMGKYAEAEPYYRESLEGRRRVLGPEHKSTLTGINNMGSLYDAMGKYSEAESFFCEAIEGCRRVLGSDHPDTLGSINNLGALYLHMSKYAEAEPFLREALDGRRGVLGAAHGETIATLLLVAEVVAQLPDRKAEAAELLQSALSAVPENSPYRATLQERLDSLVAQPR